MYSFTCVYMSVCTSRSSWAKTTWVQNQVIHVSYISPVWTVMCKRQQLKFANLHIHAHATQASKPGGTKWLSGEIRY